MMSKKEAEIRRRWHDTGFIPMNRRKDVSLSILGLKLYVPKEVYAPQPTAPQHLGKAVLKEVRDTDRVLDVGTGSGVNAILAGSKSSRVVATAINPFAIKCARKNAKLNRVGSSSGVKETHGEERLGAIPRASFVAQVHRSDRIVGSERDSVSELVSKIGFARYGSQTR
jgi:release factor glutamine methyltransferase